MRGAWMGVYNAMWFIVPEMSCVVNDEVVSWSGRRRENNVRRRRGTDRECGY